MSVNLEKTNDFDLWMALMQDQEILIMSSNFECLVGLVNAVLEMNQSFLKEKQIKIMLLIRPDIMYKMPVHNMNQKLRNNSVLLNWVTSYRKYIDSKLFKIADDYFMKQQDYSYELGRMLELLFSIQGGISGKMESTR